MSVHDTKISDFTNVLKAFYAKLVSIIPTKTSQLENDSGYKTTDNTLTNNLLATVPGTALDAVQGKVLDDKIEEVSASLGNVGTYTFVGKITNGSETFNLSESINNYKFILIALNHNGSGNIRNTSILPISVFKEFRLLSVDLYIESREYVGIEYISDVQLKALDAYGCYGNVYLIK